MIAPWKPRWPKSRPPPSRLVPFYQTFVRHLSNILQRTVRLALHRIASLTWLSGENLQNLVERPNRSQQKRIAKHSVVPILFHFQQSSHEIVEIIEF